MKTLLLGWFVSAACFASPDSLLSHAVFSRHALQTHAQERPELMPPHLGHAKEFVRFLSEHGFVVRAVGRSHLESFFLEVDKAAFIETDKGVIEAVFFPETSSAERIQVNLVRKDGRYIYSFRGQPRPTPGDVMNSNRPLYFLAHRNLLLVTDKKEVHSALKRALLRW